MKILLVINSIEIFMINSGGSLRNTLFACALSEIGHVDVIAFCNGVVSNIPNCDVVYSKELTDYFGPMDSIRTLVGTTFRPLSPYSYFKVNRQKESIIDKFVEKNGYDIIATRYVDETIKCGLLKYKDKLVIDADDNPASVLRYKAIQTHSIIEKWKKLYQSRRVGAMVEKLLDSVRCSFCSNPLELPSKRTRFLHNTTILKQPAPDISDNDDMPPRILYVGCLDFFPSRQGISHFVETIFPLIKKAIPDVELQVVGKGKPDFIDYLNGQEGVTAVGRVDDLTKEYRNAHVVIIPIYYGSGTSVKFVEAMLMNRPVVSTPMGVRGFDILCQNGVHYMLANNDEEFARNTIELLSDVQKSRELAKRGYEVVSQHFSQERFIKIVKENILE